MQLSTPRLLRECLLLLSGKCLFVEVWLALLQHCVGASLRLGILLLPCAQRQLALLLNAQRSLGVVCQNLVECRHVIVLLVQEPTVTTSDAVPIRRELIVQCPVVIGLARIGVHRFKRLKRILLAALKGLQL